MKTQVHNARALSHALTQFIINNVSCQKSSFEISDVKRDGTVFVRFKSTSAPSNAAALLFRNALEVNNIVFLQVEETKFRIALIQFSSGTL